MAKTVKLGDNMVFVKDTYGFKVAPDKCEFLDNLVIKNIDCSVNYAMDVIKTSVQNGSLLDDWMSEPEYNCGVEFTFECELYGKELKIVLSGPDHACYDEPLTTNWIDALNIIVESMYNSDSLEIYAKLPELNNKTIKEYVSSINEGGTVIVTRDNVVLPENFKVKEIKP